jgi:rubrerythrin
MFLIDFYFAISLYLFIILLGFIFASLIKVDMKYRDYSLDPRYIWYCSICTYTYVDTKQDVLSLCPRCGSYNKKI